MLLEYEAEQWLRNEGGYKYHCFISWPHTKNPDITDCARMIALALEEQLAAYFPAPRIFLDESSIIGGDRWEERLRNDLCKSIAMISVCAPISFHPEHKWCGLEWAAMQALSSCRLPKMEYTAIIPIMLRKSIPLPAAVAKVQYVDLSRVLLQGRRYYRGPEFRQKIEDVVSRIRQIIMEIGRNEMKANCEKFSFPTASAFLDYTSHHQTFPLLT